MPPCSLTALNRLAVESHSPACKTPSLRSLACMPRIRRLAVAQAHQLQSFVGLTNLGALAGGRGGCKEGSAGFWGAVGRDNPTFLSCSCAMLASGQERAPFLGSCGNCLKPPKPRSQPLQPVACRP